jgi:hypothetical protein
MALLPKHLLLGATVPPQETVSIPELGGEVIIRGMSGAERDAFEVSLVEGRGRKREVNLKNLRAKLVAYCCIDEHGARVFSNEEAEALGNMRVDVLNRMYSVAQRLSGISDQDADELGQPVTLTVSATSSSPLPKS